MGRTPEDTPAPRDTQIEENRIEIAENPSEDPEMDEFQKDDLEDEKSN